MAEFKTEYISNLPDTYSKAKTSNNYKILNIIQRDTTKLKETIEDVDLCLDIEQAKGKTLDLYGEAIGQYRGLADDNKYRIMIKSRILRNLMNGDLNSIIEAISMIFGCEKSEVIITETDEPATIKIERIPFDVINYVGLSVEQTLQLMTALVPVGIKVESIELQGSFEFGSTDNEYDESKGFADKEVNATIGGYLGFLGSEEETLLPI